MRLTFRLTALLPAGGCFKHSGLVSANIVTPPTAGAGASKDDEFSEPSDGEGGAVQNTASPHAFHLVSNGDQKAEVVNVNERDAGAESSSKVASNVTDFLPASFMSKATTPAWSAIQSLFSTLHAAKENESDAQEVSDAADRQKAKAQKVVQRSRKEAESAAKKLEKEHNVSKYEMSMALTVANFVGTTVADAIGAGCSSGIFQAFSANDTDRDTFLSETEMGSCWCPCADRNTDKKLSLAEALRGFCFSQNGGTSFLELGAYWGPGPMTPAGDPVILENGSRAASEEELRRQEGGRAAGWFYPEDSDIKPGGKPERTTRLLRYARSRRGSRR
ncbi:unnamed protein product [Amoebophrya sp. A120]|nr:unnamed protein product [Amoebophrya sp. A120]|eukprot:GSA120T00016667001.1